MTSTYESQVLQSARVTGWMFFRLRRNKEGANQDKENEIRITVNKLKNKFYQLPFRHMSIWWWNM